MKAVDKDQDDFTLKIYWQTFTIASCLRNIQQASPDMKPQTIHFSWQKLRHQIVNDYAGCTPDKVLHSAVDEIVKLCLQKDLVDSAMTAYKILAQKKKKSATPITMFLTHKKLPGTKPLPLLS